MPRRRKKDADSLIVMTPMIDIMTVLLAVFIVSAPMMTTGIDLDLPKAGVSSISGDDSALQISVDKYGRYYLGKQPMPSTEIVARAVAMKKENPKLVIMINGDSSANYGSVMGMMGKLKEAGFVKVGLRTKLDN